MKHRYLPLFQNPLRDRTKRTYRKTRIYWVRQDQEINKGLKLNLKRMIEKKGGDKPKELKPRDDGVELENQFILRLPEEPATVLHEALQTGMLWDRLKIKIDNELRYGEVRFDQWFLHAKIVDLPTIVECLKTIDNKSFYKSADICQLMICKEEPDAVDSEKESPNKGKKKDPNKVDKKYLWPHGITPPCKNVRKRRFRKTLKKKNVEAPEIEKEVKRLLRIDNDAVKVDYEIISEDVDKRSQDDQHSKEYNENDEDYNFDSTLNDGDNKSMNESSSRKDINAESDDDDMRTSTAAPNRGVGEHDIFGEEVSSSDEEDVDVERNEDPSRTRDLEEGSQLSVDETTRMSAFSMGGAGDLTTATSGGNQTLNPSQLEFNQSMFGGSPKRDVEVDIDSKLGGSSSNLAAPSGYYEDTKRPSNYDDESADVAPPQLTPEQIAGKIAELRRQCDELKVQQAQKAQEISSIQNNTLKQRMQETLDNLLSQMLEKEMEIRDYENML